jgi:hypothetical protein
MVRLSQAEPEGKRRNQDSLFLMSASTRPRYSSEVETASCASVSLMRAIYRRRHRFAYVASGRIEQRSPFTSSPPLPCTKLSWPRFAPRPPSPPPRPRGVVLSADRMERIGCKGNAASATVRSQRHPSEAKTLCPRRHSCQREQQPVEGCRRRTR